MKVFTKGLILVAVFLFAFTFIVEGATTTLRGNTLTYSDQGELENIKNLTVLNTSLFLFDETTQTISAIFNAKPGEIPAQAGSMAAGNGTFFFPNTSVGFLGDVDNIDNTNGFSRFRERNINNGSNASAGFIGVNNIGHFLAMGIGSSNFQFMNLSLPNIGVIRLVAPSDMFFVNNFHQGFFWIANSQNESSLSDPTVLMNLDQDGNLDIMGNVSLNSSLTFSHIEGADTIPGSVRMFCKSNDKCYIQLSNGEERRLIDGGGGSVLIDDILHFIEIQVFQGGINITDNSHVISDGDINTTGVICDKTACIGQGGVGGGNVTPQDLLSVYKSGTQTTTSTFTDLTGWTQEISDPSYDFNTTTGVITFNQSGRYLVSVDAKVNSATDRTTLFLQVVEDFGSGFVSDNRKFWSNYVVRNSANNEGGLLGLYIQDYTAGDRIKLQVKATDAQKDINTNFSRIFIVRMQGTTGAPGVNGIDGTDGINGSIGPPGAGSNIIVQKDNVTIGIVTNILNFEGSGVSSVIDFGLNKTTITISGGGGGGIFGSEFEKFESLGQSNTGSSFVDKLSVTTALKPAGTYRIGFTVDATNSDGTDIYKVRFSIDGAPIHQHTNGNDEYENKPNGNNDWEVYSTFSYLTLVNASTIDLLIEFGTNDNTARASNAAIEIWRVS